MDIERQEKIKKYIEKKRASNSLGMDTIMDLIVEVDRKAREETINQVLKKFEERLLK